LQGYIREHQSGQPPRHLIVLGDWNTRPDTNNYGGRTRIQAMMVPTDGANLMRVLTVEEIKPSLDDWARLQELENITANHPAADIVPFSHFNNNGYTVDTFLDHIAISRTMNEIFDHPIQVKLANGKTDLRPGIRIARPMIREVDYLHLTDHLPIVLTLRTTGVAVPLEGFVGGLRIVGAIPNPADDDYQNEQVMLKNYGTQPVPLSGWKMGDARDTYWGLTDEDGTVGPGQTVTVRRRGRPMALNNQGGDTIKLVSPGGETIDQKSYGNASSGAVFTFE